MTTRDELDKFKDLELWTTISETIGEAQNARARSADDRATLTRVKSVLEYVASYKQMPAAVFPSSREDTAQQLASQVEQVKTQIAGWDQDAGLLPQTVSQIDNSLDQVLMTVRDSGWPALFKESRARIYREAADSFVQASEASLTTLLSDVTRAQEQLGALYESVQQLKDEADARSEQAQSALREIESGREEQANQAEGELRAALQRIEANAAKVAEELASTAASQRANLEDEASEMLQRLRDAEKEGNELVSMVSDQSTGGGYLEFAEKEHKAYRIWVLTGALVTAIVLGWFAVEFHTLETLSVGVTVFKLGLTVSGLGFAAFAFREATKRSKRAVEARYRALDLLALRPYTHDLQDEQREKLTYLLGQRLFGTSVEGPSRASGESNSPSIPSPEYLKHLLELASLLRGTPAP